MSLILKNIIFSYDKNKENILKNISMEIPSGKTACILGGSGIGKSTLLRIIAGILPEKSVNFFQGEVFFNSKNISHVISEGKLSFMFQEPTLFDFLNVEKNIQFPLKILKTDDTISDSLIQIVGLDKVRKNYPSTLSGGMKTRTALARCFVTKPSLILLDEPFSDLDIAWQNILYDEFEILAKKFGATVILVTHSLQEALRLGDIIYILGKSGEIIFSGNNNKLELENLKKIIIRDHQKTKT